MDREAEWRLEVPSGVLDPHYPPDGSIAAALDWIEKVLDGRPRPARNRRLPGRGRRPGPPALAGVRSRPADPWAGRSGRPRRLGCGGTTGADRTRPRGRRTRLGRTGWQGAPLPAPDVARTARPDRLAGRRPRPSSRDGGLAAAPV